MLLIFQPQLHPTKTCSKFSKKKQKQQFLEIISKDVCLKRRKINNTVDYDFN